MQMRYDEAPHAASLQGPLVCCLRCQAVCTMPAATCLSWLMLIDISSRLIPRETSQRGAGWKEYNSRQRLRLLFQILPQTLCRFYPDCIYVTFSTLEFFSFCVLQYSCSRVPKMWLRQKHGECILGIQVPFFWHSISCGADFF